MKINNEFFKMSMEDTLSGLASMGEMFAGVGREAEAEGDIAVADRMWFYSRVIASAIYKLDQECALKAAEAANDKVGESGLMEA